MTVIACGDVAQPSVLGKEPVEAGPMGTVCDDGCGFMGLPPAFHDAGISSSDAGLPDGSVAEDAGSPDVGTITSGTSVDDAGFLGDSGGDAG